MVTTWNGATFRQSEFFANSVEKAKGNSKNKEKSIFCAKDIIFKLTPAQISSAISPAILQQQLTPARVPIFAILQQQVQLPTIKIHLL